MESQLCFMFRGCRACILPVNHPSPVPPLPPLTIIHDGICVKTQMWGVPGLVWQRTEHATVATAARVNVIFLSADGSD